MPLPEHRPIRLIPPGQHQVDLVTAAIDLKVQIAIGMACPLGVTALDPNRQVLQVPRRGGIGGYHGMAVGLEADIRSLGDQHQKIHPFRAGPRWIGSAGGSVRSGILG